MQQLQQGVTLQNGKYAIVRVLGQGGFGITYLAIQTTLNRKVAIKEFFMNSLCTRKDSTIVSVTEADEQADVVERYMKKFIKEAQILARFDNPNIVHVQDVFKENNTWYYVMEYVDGRSLESIIREKGHLSEGESLDYIGKVADALKYIHGYNVNHLDIKPSNIMVRSRDNEPILIDFGISKQYDEKKNETSTTPPGISDGYSPLEQYRPGGISTFSPQADIYALGATLYKMVTGKTPPNASDILNDGIPKVENVSNMIMTAIDKTMQPRKNDRITTIEKFLTLIKKEENTSIQKPNKKDTQPFKILQSHIGFATDKEEIVKSIVRNMIPVIGGHFIMGDKYEHDTFNDNGKPTHRVFVSSFSISRYLISQKDWYAIMGNNPSKFIGLNHPVEQISWEDCQTFVKRLNEMTKIKFRLPTEAEWEYAARGGNKSNGYIYAGSNDINQVAWFEDNSNNHTHNIAQKQPNELGLYDMTGNVYEWVKDRYAKYSAWPKVNPSGPNSFMGVGRVARGGSFCDNSRICIIPFRFDLNEISFGSNIGLRLASSIYF